MPRELFEMPRVLFESPRAFPEFPPPRPSPSFPRGEVLSLEPPKGMRFGFPPKSGLLGLRDDEEEDRFEPELEDESEEFLRRRRFEPDDRGGDRDLKNKIHLKMKHFNLITGQVGF